MKADKRPLQGFMVFAILTVWLFPLLAFAQWEARVVDIFDGDTLIVSVGGRAEIIKLFGVECPEKDQPFGLDAKYFTTGLVGGKTIRVVTVKTNRYEMVKVYIGEKCLNEELLKAGYGWYLNDTQDEQWAKMEQEARAEGKGLWAGEHPVPPWEYRKGQVKATAESPHSIKIRGKHEAESSSTEAPESPQPQPQAPPAPAK